MTPPLAETSCDNGLLQIVCTTLADHGLSANVSHGIQTFLQSVLLFAAVLLAGRFLRRLTLRAARRTGIDVQLTTLVTNFFTIATLVIAVLAALTVAGLNISVLLTFAGLSSLAIGLAFQDLLRNVLAGIFLLIERPFRIGDWITVGNQSGSVETIQLRTTALRTGDGQLAILPNLSAFSNPVVNATAYDRRQFSVAVRLAPGAGLEAAMRKVREALEQAEGVLREPKPFVQPRLDADGGVTLVARYWVEYRSHDPDALSAALVGALYEALGPWPAPVGTAPGTGAGDTPAAGQAPKAG